MDYFIIALLRNASETECFAQIGGNNTDSKKHNKVFLNKHTM